MSRITTLIKKITVLSLLFTLFISSALPANAAISEDIKDHLDAVISGMTSSAQISEIVTYLYTNYLNQSLAPYTTPALGSNTTPSTAITGNTSTRSATETAILNARLCDYANRLTLDLSYGTTHSRVRLLQAFLNTLAANNSAYQPVTRTGEGSLGRETDYYGDATKAAVARWQALNLASGTYTLGAADSVTQAKMRANHCTTSSGTTTGIQTPTTQTPTGTGNTSTSGTGTGATSPIVSNPVSLSKPELSFDKTSVNKGERVSYDVDLRNNPIDGCRLNAKFVNQNQTQDNIVFSKNSGTYSDYPQLTTEYYIHCSAAGAQVESDHVTVVVDGVTAGAGAGTGAQSISVQGANGETPWYTMSGGEYRYFFHINANVASGAIVTLNYGSSNGTCSGLGNSVGTTNSMTNTFITTIAASELTPGRTYYYCAAATVNGTVAAQTPVGSFVAK